MQGTVHQNKSPLLISHFYFERVEKNTVYGSAALGLVRGLKTAYRIGSLSSCNRADIHLDGAVVVVGEVRQRRPVLAQCVVAGVGVVVVVTVRNICGPKQTHGITTAAVKITSRSIKSISAEHKRQKHNSEIQPGPHHYQEKL